MTQTAFEGGFANAPITAAVAFRSVLDALSRPGTIATLAGEPARSGCGWAGEAPLAASRPSHFAAVSASGPRGGA